MIPTYAERLAKIKSEHPRDMAVEGLISYGDRLRRLAEDELLAVLRNKWMSYIDKAEAMAQLFEARRDRTVY